MRVDIAGFADTVIAVINIIVTMISIMQTAWIRKKQNSNRPDQD